jgi:hypothetical protein
MPKLILRYCTIENPKADFLKHEIKFAVSLPLTDDNLKLRDKFEFLAGEKKSVTVEIESAQLPLFDDAPAASSLPKAKRRAPQPVTCPDCGATMDPRALHLHRRREHSV